MPGSRPSTADKRKTFRKLHEVRLLRHSQSVECRQRALSARASASRRWRRPAPATPIRRVMPTARRARDEVLAHYRELAAATDMPLNADFENGFADDPDGVAENVTRCIATGVAGLSIEDSPNDGTTPLYDFDLAVARVKAARAAIDQRRRRRGVHRARRKFHPRRARSRRHHPPAQGLSPRPAPIASTRRASRPASRSRRWSRRWRRSRSISSTAARSASRSTTSRRWACGASASAARSPASPCTPSSASPPRSPRTASSTASPGSSPIAELNKFFSEDRKKLVVMTASEPHPQTGQPVGLPVDDPTPAPRPGSGDARRAATAASKSSRRAHATDLWAVFAGHDEVWTYISADGPFANAADVCGLASPDARRRTILTPTRSSTPPIAPSAI